MVRGKIRTDKNVFIDGNLLGIPKDILNEMLAVCEPPNYDINVLRNSARDCVDEIEK